MPRRCVHGAVLLAAQRLIMQAVHDFSKLRGIVVHHRFRSSWLFQEVVRCRCLFRHMWGAFLQGSVHPKILEALGIAKKDIPAWAAWYRENNPQRKRAGAVAPHEALRIRTG